jgi:hypothetical protein
MVPHLILSHRTDLPERKVEWRSPKTSLLHYCRHPMATCPKRDRQNPWNEPARPPPPSSAIIMGDETAKKKKKKSPRSLVFFVYFYSPRPCTCNTSQPDSTHSIHLFATDSHTLLMKKRERSWYSCGSIPLAHSLCSYTLLLPLENSSSHGL